MSNQLEGFPLNVISYQPIAPKKSAHAFGWAECDDGNKYLVKGYGDAPIVCAHEWVCTSVADFLHLPTAPCKVLKMKDGTLVFGSRYLGSELKPLVVSRILKSGMAPNDLLVPELVPNLSRLYALDMFIGNTDRHLFNYLFIEERAEGSPQRIARFYATDFDAADLLIRDRITLPMVASSNTVSTGRQIRGVYPFDSDAAAEMLTRLGKAPEIILGRAMDGLPTEWFSKVEQQRFLERISSTDLPAQIAELQQGLSNGPHL